MELCPFMPDISKDREDFTPFTPQFLNCGSSHQTQLTAAKNTRNLS